MRLNEMRRENVNPDHVKVRHKVKQICKLFVWSRCCCANGIVVENRVVNLSISAYIVGNFPPRPDVPWLHAYEPSPPPSALVPAWIRYSVITQVE